MDHLGEHQDLNGLAFNMQCNVCGALSRDFSTAAEALAWREGHDQARHQPIDMKLFLASVEAQYQLDQQAQRYVAQQEASDDGGPPFKAIVGDLGSGRVSTHRVRLECGHEVTVPRSVTKRARCRRCK